MDALIMDKDFNVTNILDSFISFIWTDRYQSAGDFEVYVPASEEMAKMMPIDGYLSQDASPYCMVIEEMQCLTDVEDGNKMLFKGRSLESLLERRVIWNRIFRTDETTLNLQTAVERALNENAINPSDPNRKIPGLKFVQSVDPNVTNHYVKGEVRGQNLYDTIVEWCTQHNIGFRILPNYETKELSFSLYYGNDYSYDQDQNPYVVFDPQFGNLVSSDYVATRKDFRTVCLVVGPQDTADPDVDYTMSVYLKAGAGSGLDRREIAVDMTSSNLPTPQALYKEYTDELGETYSKPCVIKGKVQYTDESIAKYNEARAQLLADMEANGREKLSQHTITEAFNGEVQAVQQFVYGKDFFLGDIVSVRNEYKLECQMIVSEVVRTCDQNGETILPTFIKREPHAEVT